MIKKIAYFYLTCDSCRIETIEAKTHAEARKKGWAISRDRKHCYCVECAKYERKGVKK